MKLHIALQTPAPLPQSDTCKFQSQSPTTTEESRDHRASIMPSTKCLLWSKTIFSPEKRGKIIDGYISVPTCLTMHGIPLIRHLQQNTRGGYLSRFTSQVQKGPFVTMSRREIISKSQTDFSSLHSQPQS